MSKIRFTQIDGGSEIIEDINTIKNKTNNIERLNYKTICFYFESVLNGRIGSIIKFPFDGEITSIDAFCAVEPDEDIQFVIEKTDTDGNYNSILNEDEFVTINKDSLVANTVESFNSEVKKDDYFRINFVKPEKDHVSTLKNLTVQVNILI